MRSDWLRRSWAWSAQRSPSTRAPPSVTTVSPGGDSLAPPQAAPTFTGVGAAPPASGYRVYAVALAAALLGGGGAALVLSRRAPDVAGPPRAVEIQPQWPFNIIYSSGTTGEPKGIVQSHGMRWSHVRRGAAYGYGPGTATIVSTPPPPRPPSASATGNAISPISAS